MPGDIVISIPKQDSELAEQFAKSPALNAVELPGAGMDGGGEWIVLIIHFSNLVSKALVELLKANWDRAKHVKVEMDGMIFTGASLHDISAFLDNHPAHHESKR